ncbi:VOC family protein [Bordetella genomosp. 13]|uniref:VOC family protein n=1 Tax=Bordetella genomosp. 13 TaxID=463040 RepID=UPI0011A156EE|nr:VOC family protein [Bordetella genomosp. 13]
MDILINVDVDDLPRGERFYCDAFGLAPQRRFGAGGVELTGANARLYLLQKPTGTRACRTTGQTRDYARHWTPVHLDFVVDDVDAAVARAVRAGATLEDPPATHDWGRIAHLCDPFGHGLCILQFSARGYDAVATPA